MLLSNALLLRDQGDRTPDQFTFTDVSGVATSTTQTSDPVTLTGLGQPAPITVTNGTYSINGGVFTSSAGSVYGGDQVRARHTSAANSGTDTDTVVTIGGVSDTFTSTTGIDFVGYESGTDTCDLPAGWAAGDLALIYIYNNGSSATPGAGWTQLGSDLGNTFSCYYRFLQSGDGSVTLTNTTDFPNTQIVAYRNIGGVSLLDTYYDTSDDQITFPSPTLSGNNIAIVSFAGQFNQGGFEFSAPTNLSELRGLTTDQLITSAAAADDNGAYSGGSITWDASGSTGSDQFAGFLVELTS